MAKILWFRLPGWSPQQAAYAVYRALVGAGKGGVEYMHPATVKVKRGGLLLWEGEATITAYQQGEYIGLRLDTSETRSFLTGGLLGRSKAKKAEKELLEAIYRALGRPISISEA